MIWKTLIAEGVQKLLEHNECSGAHFASTPKRVLATYENMFQRNWYDDHLAVTFPVQSSMMIHVAPVRITAWCAHHLLPIVGVAHFAYIPDSKVVGLSKIPRFIRGISCAAPTVQEDLTVRIARVFQERVQPVGCGVWMRCYHSCMSARGVLEHDALTTTTALEGNFLSSEKARQEFLGAVDTRMRVVG